jgi:hypothetical protein
VSRPIWRGTQFFLTDGENHRVLVYNSFPQSTGQPADFVIGQADFITNSAGTTATAVIGQTNFTNAIFSPINERTLNMPFGLIYVGGKFFVIDTNRNRILIYNAIPSSSNVSADLVIGQNDFTSSLANQGGVPSAATLSKPTDVFFYNCSLYVVDQNNHRVLVY